MKSSIKDRWATDSKAINEAYAKKGKEKAEQGKPEKKEPKKRDTLK